MSTERGTVHAVALSDDDGRLPERVLVQRSVRIRGEGKPELAQAVEVALESLADEIGPDREIVGAAVTYRDAAERRAIVSGLADGAWHDASLVSVKSAHLALAGAMSWVDEFENLAICEVVPGHQAFSLISPERDRVVSAVASTGAVVTKETMVPAVTAAWDQFDAAGVRPDAVVLIGSAASEPAVASALAAGFGAPILPSRVAAAGSAIGAALVALPESAGVVDAGERARFSRSTAALFAAASVLAGGLVAGGVYEISRTRSDGTPVLADARVAADSHRTRPMEEQLPFVPEPVVAQEHPEMPVVADSGSPSTEPVATVVTLDTTTMTWGPEGTRRLNLRQDTQSNPAGEDTEAAKAPAPAMPETGSAGTAPATPGTSPAVAPNGSLLFPGEPAPPEITSPEFMQWWDNHWRLTMQWASAQVMPRT
ncbi:hypothetical protein NDR87_32700 [Nocardia sp. CDC159]|uniref:DUF7159 domain-containing protein n=1 Tax=Nocardia pulmonis TaxID=2951408 RepID=A0A9X2J080_9NOCA|nr:MULTISPECIES: hypothetical protein [Nocardia]MCM6778253.1 hypothetical protein [Nocardia pulmonis]MCM6791142.1 hypothetical protein [Nocardia sp. CDC159]